MIEIIKKKYKEGSTIIIYTDSDSFKGKIIQFSDSFIELETENSTEFLSINNIVRFSFPKEQNIEKENDKEIQTTKQVGNKTETKDDIDNKDKNYDKKKETTKYEVGDIIPLDELEKRTSKKKPKIKNKKTKFTKSIKDLSELKKLLLPEIEEQNKKIVSAIGSIHRYFGDRNFGFIYDQYNVSVWFSFNDIIDDNLLNTLRGTVINTNIPVLFSLTKNYKGDKAIFIQKPDTVENIIKKAKSFFEEKNKPDTAIGLLEQILYVYPDNIEASNLKKEYEKKRFKYISKPSKKYRTYDLNYQKAKKLHNVEKNPSEALKYYLIALENNEKRESCIKDIAMLYVSLGENEKALDFMKQHEAELPKNITTYNYLENFYSSVKQFDKVIEYIDLLLSERLIEKDNRKYSMYLSKKGFALFQLGEIEEAKNILQEATSIHQENTYAYRLLEAIENPDKEEAEQLVAEAEEELAFLGSEISNFLRQQLNLCQFDGLKSSSKSKIIESGEFKAHYLDEIRETLKLKVAIAGKSKERAEYLLTEARLMTELEPHKDNELRSVLAKYCNARASQAISEMYESSLDVARYFFSEAFTLEEDWKSLRT